MAKNIDNTLVCICFDDDDDDDDDHDDHDDDNDDEDDKCFRPFSRILLKSTFYF